MADEAPRETFDEHDVAIGARSTDIIEHGLIKIDFLYEGGRYIEILIPEDGRDGLLDLLTGDSEKEVIE